MGIRVARSFVLAISWQALGSDLVGLSLSRELEMLIESDKRREEKDSEA